MPTARVNGIETYYEVTGQGVPTLFIHGGYGGAPTTLVPQQGVEPDILPKDVFATIVYDRRSAGRSQYIAEPYTLPDLAADAAGLLDHLGHDRAIIIGSSAGGPIALQFALNYPERVIALGLPNTSANLSNPERAVGRDRRELVDRAAKEGDRAVFEERKARLREAPAMGAVAPVPGMKERMEERQRSLTEALGKVSDEDLFRYYQGELRNYGAYIDFDFTPQLAELTMPVCIIHGDADGTVPFAWGEALHHGIAGSEFHRIGGGEHGILRWPDGAAALREWALRVIRSG